MAANKVQKQVFRAPRKEFTDGSHIVRVRKATNKTSKEEFDVLCFADGAEVLVPNGWNPIGFTIYVSPEDNYRCGWNGRQFYCEPVELK